MAAGRGFRDDEVRRRARVAILSYPLFVERFGGDAARLRQGIVRSASGRDSMGLPEPIQP